MPKIYAVCGAAGFVLSFIVGLFSGASFLLILLKAVIFGAVFAGLAVLINFLLNRFVPDLFDKEAIAALKPKASGAKLDITISDEDDASPEDDLSSFPDFMKHRSQAKSAPPRASAVASGAVPSEVGETAESAPASEVAQSEIAPSQAEAKPEEEASSTSSVSEEESGGELDDMPDAEVFASEDEEFGSDGVESEDASDREPSPSTESTAPKFSANGVDAELMARAIRTVLSKNN